jgi:stress response protein YsnF
VDQLLHAEEVEIERVAINRIVEEPLPIRHEGDTTIIPLLAEVLVIEKRLVLREEVHIRKLRKEVHDPQEVLLREERVEIVRKPGSGQDLRQDDIQQ